MTTKQCSVCFKHRPPERQTKRGKICKCCANVINGTKMRGEAVVGQPELRKALLACGCDFAKLPSPFYITARNAALGNLDGKPDPRELQFKVDTTKGGSTMICQTCLGVRDYNEFSATRATCRACVSVYQNTNHGRSVKLGLAELAAALEKVDGDHRRLDTDRWVVSSYLDKHYAAYGVPKRASRVEADAERGSHRHRDRPERTADMIGRSRRGKPRGRRKGADVELPYRAAASDHNLISEGTPPEPRRDDRRLREMMVAGAGPEAVQAEYDRLYDRVWNE